VYGGVKVWGQNFGGLKVWGQNRISEEVSLATRRRGKSPGTAEKQYDGFISDVQRGSVTFISDVQ
jgi:hypothetical protein